MKKSFIMRLVAMALVIVSAMAITLPAMADVPVPEGTTKWVKDGYLNFRTTASTSSKRIEKIANYMPVIELEESGAWSWIFYNGSYGYVQNKYLTSTSYGYTRPQNENMAFGHDTLYNDSSSIKNHHVYNLQLCLQAGQYLTDTPDGIYGTNTEAAVRQFQQDAQIEVDGKVGEDTRGKLWERFRYLMLNTGVLELSVY